MRIYSAGLARFWRDIYKAYKILAWSFLYLEVFTDLDVLLPRELFRSGFQFITTKRWLDRLLRLVSLVWDRRLVLILILLLAYFEIEPRQFFAHHQLSLDPFFEL
jgi:hypothetical protein